MEEGGVWSQQRLQEAEENLKNAVMLRDKLEEEVSLSPSSIPFFS